LSSPNPRVPIRRIMALFRPYRWSLLFVAVLVGTSSLVSLVNPFLIREVIDVALPRGRTGLLTLLALGMIVVSIANSSFSVSQTYVSTKVGQRVMHDLRTAVYSQLARRFLRRRVRHPVRSRGPLEHGRPLAPVHDPDRHVVHARGDLLGDRPNRPR